MNINYSNFSLKDLFEKESGFQVRDKFENQEDMQNYWTERRAAEKVFVKKVYEQLIKDTEGKTYLELLPKDLLSKSRSIIKSDILRSIDETYKWLMESPFYEDKTITKERLTLYLMIGRDYDNFYLSKLFIYVPSPFEFTTKMFVHINKLESESGVKFTEDQKDKLMDEFRKDNKELQDYYYEAERILDFFKNNWDPYKNRQDVKQGKLVHSYDMGEDGFPVANRGTLCYLFIPVKNFDQINKDLNHVGLYNPRKKTKEIFTNVKYKEGENIYSAVNEKGKKVFFADFEDVNNSWDALFSINKEIYSGWWNRILEFNLHNKNVK